MGVNRMPMLGSAGIHSFFNGPESFTPDDRYYLGEAPELGGYWVAAGYNSIGIVSSGGAGMALAQWIKDGEPPFDLWEVDIRRAQPFQKNRRYLRERVTETLGLLYADHFPYRQMASARGIRRSPLHEHLRRAARCSAKWPAGSAPTGSPFPARSAATAIPGSGRTGSRTSAPSIWRCATRRRPVRHVVLRQDPRRGHGTPAPSCSGSAATISTWRRAASSTRRC